MTLIWLDLNMGLLANQLRLTLRFSSYSPFFLIRRTIGQMMDPEDRSKILPDHEKTQLTKSDVKPLNGPKVPNITYKETLSKLMEFDNNTTVLKKVHPKNIRDSKLKLKLMIQLLEAINIKLDDLNNLNVIHVAGTKGKGSTCAYVERILRERGYKTGLYSSPHLVSVRERIRLCGQPLSVESFIKYFWSVQSKIDGYGEKPGFFMFLTLLSFHVFLEEKVDVVILETGIGGEFDCTNIVTRPIVTGITSLGIDHTTVLGDTLESIAWHKAGILKPNVLCFSSPQPECVLKVIHERSIEKGCRFFVCPSIEDYARLSNQSITIGIDGPVQKFNASLALQLSRYFHNTMIGSQAPNNTNILIDSNGFALDSEEMVGLERTKWPGRCQVINRGRIDYYLDGAHTVESLDNCLEWFKQKSHRRSETFRVLMFFSAGLRQYEPLIRRVAQEEFHVAIFPSNYIDNPTNYPEMMVDIRYDADGITDRIKKTRQLWQWIQKETQSNHDKSYQFSSLTQAITYLESEQFIESHSLNLDRQIQVLVTGSLLFVGNVLTLIDSNLSCLDV